MKKRMIGIIASALLTACFLHGAERVWSGNGKASVGANWVGGNAPGAGDDIVFNGTSTSNCEWDVEIALGSWAQTIAYSGKVTVPKSDSMLFKVTGDIEVRGGHLVFAGDTTAVGSGTESVKHGIGYTLEAANIIIGTNASINADGQGFARQNGPGAGRGVDYGGAGHGGAGGYREQSGSRGKSYGNASAPTSLGSGGGHFSYGGAGGGAIKIVAASVSVDGILSADGGNGITTAAGMGGSGGSIWIKAGVLSGNGRISANGGLNISGWRGSGGGRIDISEVTNNFSGSLEVLGWNGGNSTYRRGLYGSLLLPWTDGRGLVRNRLVVTNELHLGCGLDFGAIIVTNGGALYFDSNENSEYFNFDTLDIYTNSKVIIQGDYERINEPAGGSAAVPYGAAASISGRVVRVHSGGSLNADGQGCLQLMGGGRGVSSDYCGSAYGGAGAKRSATAFYGNPFGSAFGPTALGSGGPHTTYSGHGGGAIKLATDTIVVNGRLSADGGNGTAGQGFGGSGGAIWLVSGTLEGNGVISANGGFNNADWRGSGGGRIDLSGTVNNFTGLIEALGADKTVGTPLRRKCGKAGSIVFPATGTGLTTTTLVVSNELHLGYGQTYGAIVVTNDGHLFLEANEGYETFAFDSLTVHNGGRITLVGDYELINGKSGGTVQSRHGGGVSLAGNSLHVYAGGEITAKGWGFLSPEGPGGVPNVQNYPGAGHGGPGGDSDGLTRGLTYGTVLEPTALGSGGAHTQYGGYGGGAVKMILSGACVIDGSLNVDGESPRGAAGGGGSGGSIWLEADTLGGTGTISADGGAGYNDANSCGGGGGRIYIRVNGVFGGLITAGGGNAKNAAKNGADGYVTYQNLAIPNVAPNTPTPVYPTNGATMRAPYLQFKATDDNHDLLRFKVEVATDAAFNNIVRTIDQTASQELWHGQMEELYTAYFDNQVATVVVAPPLDPGTTYYWRARATDFEGSQTWSSPSETRQFSTFDVPANWWVSGVRFGDKKWETAANWSRREVPQPGSHVRFDGGYFDVPCVAANASNNLASLTLGEACSNSVLFAANGVEKAMTLNIAGDLVVASGKLGFAGDHTVAGDGTESVKFGLGYRVFAKNIVVGHDAALHCDGGGFPQIKGPGAGTGNDNGRGSGYGGVGGDGSNASLRSGGGTYGTNIWPTALGSGGGHSNNSGYGGGALWLLAGNDIRVDGRISANGGASVSYVSSGSSGGSLLLAANSISGEGVISANGGFVPGTPTGGKGSGGRITILYGSDHDTRMKVLGGRLDRAAESGSLPVFNGNIEAVPNTGFANSPPQPAGDGVALILRALPPGGTVMMLR